MFMPSIFGRDMFDDFFGDFPFMSSAVRTGTDGLMKTDVKEMDQCYELTMDMPGIQKDNVTAELKDGYLTVRVETKSNEDQKDEQGKYIRRERYYGSAKRTFYVGDAVKEEDIKAKFENGTLKLLIPKKEVQPEVEQKKYIAIEG